MSPAPRQDSTVRDHVGSRNIFPYRTSTRSVSASFGLTSFLPFALFLSSFYLFFFALSHVFRSPRLSILSRFISPLPRASLLNCLRFLFITCTFSCGHDRLRRGSIDIEQWGGEKSSPRIASLQLPNTHLNLESMKYIEHLDIDTSFHHSLLYLNGSISCAKQGRGECVNTRKYHTDLAQ